MIRVNMVIEGPLEALIAGRLEADKHESAEDCIRMLLEQHLLTPDPNGIEDQLVQVLEKDEWIDATDPAFWQAKRQQLIDRHSQSSQ